MLAILKLNDRHGELFKENFDKLLVSLAVYFCSSRAFLEKLKFTY